MADQPAAPQPPPPARAPRAPIPPPPQQRPGSTVPLAPRAAPPRQDSATPPYGLPAPPAAGRPRPDLGPPPGYPAALAPAPSSNRLPLALMLVGLLIIVGVSAAYFLTRQNEPAEQLARNVPAVRTATRRPRPTEEPAAVGEPEPTEEEEPAAGEPPEEATKEVDQEPTEEADEDSSTEPTEAARDEPTEEADEDSGAEPTPQRARGPAEPIFADDFSDESVGRWPDEDSDVGGYHYVDEAYQIRVDAAKKILWVRTNDSYETVDAQVDVKLLEGAEDNTAFGLVLMENDDGTLYVFQISADGSYAFRKSLGDNSWRNLVEWTPCDAINRGTGQTNRLRAVANGSSIDLYINDQLIDSVADQAPYLQGTVGFAASTFETDHALVEFDNFTLREP